MGYDPDTARQRQFDEIQAAVNDIAQSITVLNAKMDAIIAQLEEIVYLLAYPPACRCPKPL